MVSTDGITICVHGCYWPLTVQYTIGWVSVLVWFSSVQILYLIEMYLCLCLCATISLHSSSYNNVRHGLWFNKCNIIWRSHVLDCFTLFAVSVIMFTFICLHKLLYCYYLCYLLHVEHLISYLMICWCKYVHLMNVLVS